MQNADTIIDLRNNTREALASHVRAMVDNAATAEEAMRIANALPSFLNVERAFIRDHIKYGGWTPNAEPKTIDPNRLADLLQDCVAAFTTPLTSIVETAPLADRNYAVINHRGFGSYIGMGMFTTEENARAAQMEGADGKWFAYVTSDNLPDSDVYVLVYDAAEPFVVRNFYCKAEALAFDAGKGRIFARLA